eukprot:scaffold311702_cov21-Tisochrysis_lutea.AAC.1
MSKYDTRTLQASANGPVMIEIGVLRGSLEGVAQFLSRPLQATSFHLYPSLFLLALPTSSQNDLNKESALTLLRSCPYAPCAPALHLHPLCVYVCVNVGTAVP